MRDRLEQEARTQGLKLEFAHRAKDVPSFVKKALSRGKQYEEITDKAGARVIYHYEWQGRILQRLIDDVFVVVKREDKTAELPPDRLGYLGIHYDVRFREDDEQAPEIDLEQPTCEIQLHTRQQNTWAVYSHELLYKAPQELPQEVRRDLYRLVALVELYDREVNRARDVILSQPGYAVARVLDRLEREFYRLIAREYDGDLSRRLLECVLPLYGDQDPVEGLDLFLTANIAKIDQIYRMYVEDQRASPLLFQPEALVLFDLIERMPAKLDETFQVVAARDLLMDLATVWGKPYPDAG